jgi:two-component system, LytTR family, sensor kinase
LSPDQVHEANDGRGAEPRFERHFFFWVVCLGVWLFIAFVMDLSLYAYDQSFSFRLTRYDLSVPFFNSLIWGFLTPIVVRLALRYPIEKSNAASRTAWYLLGGIGFTIVHVALRGLIFPVRNPATMQTSKLCFSMFTRLFLADVVEDLFEIYLPLVVVGLSISYYRRFKNKELRASQLATELAHAQLQALKNQLQPHFLFNTMNSISALMFTDVQAADKMMSRLSDFLRMTLDSEATQETTLGTELEFVDGYLQIEKIRFGDRLSLTEEIDPATLDARVPHLLLQPIVENAIRHGISHNCGEGRIHIVSRHDNQYLYLAISDNGPGFSASGNGDRGDGIGLTTTRKRLQALYGEAQQVEIHNAPSSGVEVCVRIPLLREDNWAGGD